MSAYCLVCRVLIFVGVATLRLVQNRQYPKEYVATRIFHMITDQALAQFSSATGFPKWNITATPLQRHKNTTCSTTEIKFSTPLQHHCDMTVIPLFCRVW
jgi:hypothetical protein